jgi:hypothetical protein
VASLQSPSASRCCSPSACCGLQATPVPFRLEQCPPAAYLSCAGFPDDVCQVLLHFRRRSRFWCSRFRNLSVPGVVRASLPCPRVDSRHGSVAASFGLQATPDSYYAACAAFVRRISTPWLPSTLPGSHIGHPRRGRAFWRISPLFPLVTVAILRFLGPDMSLSIAFSRSSRWSPAACWVCKLPLSLFRPRTVPPGCEPRLLLSVRWRQPAFPDFVSVPSCLPFPLAGPAAL